MADSASNTDNVRKIATLKITVEAPRRNEPTVVEPPRRNEPRVNSCKLINRGNYIPHYAPETRLHICDEENKIKIFHIGPPNDSPTKTILLLGETGAGKTRLLNSFYNFLCKVDYEDPFRMEVMDEIGSEAKEVYDSQTEYITGYLFFHEWDMRYDYNILIIDTPGMGDTRGACQQKQIINQIQVFLREAKFGIIDLHCLGLVIKASTNRRLEYFGEIIRELVTIFGNHSVFLPQILATYGSTKLKNGKALLRSWGVHTEMIFNFENGNLYEPNIIGQLDSCGDKLKERDIEKHKQQWREREEEMKIFFGNLFHTPAVSLRLTRKTLREKSFLELTNKNLSTSISNTIPHIIAHKEQLKNLQNYKKSMNENRAWKSTVLKCHKTEDSQGLHRGRGCGDVDEHVHNCNTCKKTCTDVCHAATACPDNNAVCVVCHCLGTCHSKAYTRIIETWTPEDVTDADMKKRFESAQCSVAALEQEISEVKAKEEKLRKDIALMVKYVTLQSNRLRDICLMPIEYCKTPDVYLTDILRGVLDGTPTLKKDLEADFNTSFIRSVLDATTAINVDVNTLKEEIQALLRQNNARWDQLAESAATGRRQ